MRDQASEVSDQCVRKRLYNLWYQRHLTNFDTHHSLSISARQLIINSPILPILSGISVGKAGIV